MNGFTIFIIVFNAVCIAYSLGIIIFGFIRNAKNKKKVKEKLQDEFKEKL